MASRPIPSRSSPPSRESPWAPLPRRGRPFLRYTSSSRFFARNFLPCFLSLACPRCDKRLYFRAKSEFLGDGVSQRGEPVHRSEGCRRKVCSRHRSGDYARASTGAPETRATCCRDVIVNDNGYVCDLHRSIARFLIFTSDKHVRS